MIILVYTYLQVLSRQIWRDIRKIIWHTEHAWQVAGSLQNLVGIGKDLISSVERFKVD